jgi:hypothetical protein
MRKKGPDPDLEGGTGGSWIKFYPGWPPPVNLTLISPGRHVKLADCLVPGKERRSLDHLRTGRMPMATVRQIPITLVTLGLCAALSGWSAQVPGFAEITSPVQGQPISGVVTIQGTAFHPAFKAYGVSFAYDPNPTDTWFPIGERVTTPVSDGRLAVWDTSGLTPGTYQLRLTVYVEEGKTIETDVGGLLIGRQPTLGASSSGTLATSSPSAPTPIGPPPASQPSESATQVTPWATLLQVLKVGALSASAALALLGIYAALRPRVRHYLGSVQSRGLDPKQRSHRRGERR